MKKTLSFLLAMSFFGGSVFAERSEQAAELRNLIDEAETAGYTVDYEKSATAVFESFQEIESDTTMTDEQMSYTARSMDLIYSNTKSALESYISGIKKPFPAISFPADGTRNISGNTFVDADGNPLQSVGFGHFSQVISDADILKEMGSNNLQNEIGPHNVSGSSNIKNWSISNNSNCDADTTVEEDADGNRYVKIVNRSAGIPNTYVLMRQIVPVEPSTNYIISFDASASSATSVLVLPNGWSTRHTLSVGTDMETHSVGSRYTTASDQYYTELMLIFENTSSHEITLNLDNITLKNMRTKENAVLNGDFESDGKYYFHVDSLISTLDKLEEAGDKGFSVDLLISPHYMPSYMLSSYPEMAVSTSSFLQYNINHPIAKQYITEYINFIMHFVKRYDNIESICVSNEPNFYSSESYDYYNPIFREWMRERYNDDISELNTAHGSSYKSFDSVSIPYYLKNTSGYPRADALFYDYMIFNEEQVTSWHKMLRDAVKAAMPEIPVHCKMQDYLYTYDFYSFSKLLVGSNNAEAMAEFMDIAGNDATAYAGVDGTQNGTMMWYDFLSSVTGKPVYNSEDHVIKDNNTDYSDAQAQNVRYSLLSGAIHGRNASSLWIWENPTGNVPAGLFRNMPYAAYITGRTMLDMTRLTNEINAFQTAPADTAFFYSPASRVHTIYSYYHNRYEEALETDYDIVSALGHKTGFVTEYAPEKVSNYKTLILTGVENIPEKSVQAIADFIRGGGNVIIDGENSLSETEYGLPASSDDREFIKSNAYYVSERTVDAFNDAYLYFGENGSFVKEFGEAASGIDLKTAEYNGETLIYITNFTDAGKTVTLDEAGNYLNLVTGEECSENVALAPYEPVILQKYEVDAEADTTAVFGESSVKFNFNYDTKTEQNLKMVVLVKNSDGVVLGFAYADKNVYPGKDNKFCGTIDCENAVEAEFIVFNNNTGAEVYRQSIGAT